MIKIYVTLTPPSSSEATTGTAGAMVGWLVGSGAPVGAMPPTITLELCSINGTLAPSIGEGVDCESVASSTRKVALTSMSFCRSASIVASTTVVLRRQRVHQLK